MLRFAPLTVAAFLAAIPAFAQTASPQQRPTATSSPEYKAFRACISEQYLTGDYNGLNVPQSLSRVMNKCPHQMFGFMGVCEKEFSGDTNKTDKCLMVTATLIGLIMNK